MSGFSLRPYRRFLGVCLLGFMVNTVVLTSAHADDDLLAQVLTSLKDANAEYVNRCSNGGYKAKQWSSETRCLQDGRVHLVYEVDAKTGEPVDTFGQADLETLFQAINDGAQILVKEVGKKRQTVIYECTASAVYRERNQNLYATCSSNDFNWPDYLAVNSAARKVWFSTRSDGLRMHRYHPDSESYAIKHILDPVGKEDHWVKKSSWYVRY